MSCHPTAEGTGVFKGVICALCLSVTVLSACLCVGFILPNRLTLVSGIVFLGHSGLTDLPASLTQGKPDFVLLALICKNPKRWAMCPSLEQSSGHWLVGGAI